MEESNPQRELEEFEYLEKMGGKQAKGLDAEDAQNTSERLYCGDQQSNLVQYGEHLSYLIILMATE
jgi:hypothetical protein